MLVKINRIDERDNKAYVTKLDIDDYGSIIPVNNLELSLPANDDAVIQILKNSTHAAVFTQDDIDDNNAIIISASGLSNEELNREKQKTIDALSNKK